MKDKRTEKNLTIPNYFTTRNKENPQKEIDIIAANSIIPGSQKDFRRQTGESFDYVDLDSFEPRALSSIHIENKTQRKKISHLEAQNFMVESK